MASPGRRLRGRHGVGSTYGATFLGAWESGQPYAIGDVVDRSSVLYQCIEVHTNQVPPNATYWRAVTGSGGSGDVVGPSSSVASEVALFDGTTGKLIKRAAATGIAKLASGVLSAVTTWAGAGLTGTADGVPNFDSGGAAATLAPPGSNRPAYVLGWTAAGALAWVALSTGMVVCGDPAVPTGDNSSGVERTT